MNGEQICRLLGNKWLRLAVTLLLLAALAQQLSLVIWHFVPLPVEAALARPAPAPSAVGTASGGADYRQQAAAIGRAYLFGRQQVQRAEVQVVEEAPPTQLNYKLRGIYYSPDPALSSAIIEIKPRENQFFRIDDELDDKIVLAGIEADHILINRYGKLERLNLEKREQPAGQASAAVSTAAVNNQSSALLRSYKRRYASNPMALATRFQAIPVQQDGQNIGFKLKALRGESLLRRLDFDPEDIFTSVNGVSLANPFEAVEALRSLTTAESFSVTFLRNGVEQTLDFSI